MFGDIEEEPLYYLATILDPRYKDCSFTLAAKRQATEMLQEKLHSNEEDCAQPDEPPPAKRRGTDCNNSLMGMFEAILEENTEAAEHHGTRKVDVNVSVYSI